jgi:hypothetical protein
MNKLKINTNTCCPLIIRTLLLLILLSTINYADIRFVSKTGTSQFPYTSWQTSSDSIQKCLDSCSDGDTVYVANGTYKETLIINKSISLIGSSMDSTIIDGTGLSGRVKGLEGVTVYVNAATSIENFRIIGNYINDITFSGVVVADNYNSLRIINSFISNAGTGIEIVGGNSYMANLFISNCRHKNIYLWTYSGNYIDTIQNCIAVKNYSSDGSALQVDCIYSLVRNNLFVASGNNTLKGIDFIYAYDCYIRNNYILGFYEGMSIGSINDSAIIENNLIGYAGEEGIFSTIGMGQKIKIRNNIFLSNNKAVNTYYGDSINVNTDYNIYWKNQITNPHGLIMGPHDITANPMFMKEDSVLTYPLNSDYHLQAFSPGIDNGDPSILDKDGSRSDIGAFGGPGGESYKYIDLPPSPPVHFNVITDSAKIKITWNPNTEADFRRYKIYRDTTASVAVDTNYFYAYSDSSLFIDTDSPSINKLFYRITSIDKQGNESNSGEMISVVLTGVTGHQVEIIRNYSLYQNYPNPFNPDTKISYILKDKGYVKLMVYDLLGKLVKVLVNETKQSGYYETEFNAKGLASGIYIYRIEVIGSNNIPKYSDMKKMILLK